MLQGGELHTSLVLFRVPDHLAHPAIDSTSCSKLLIAKALRRRRKDQDRPAVFLEGFLLLMFSSTLLVDEAELLDAIEHVRDDSVQLFCPNCVHWSQDVQVIGIFDRGGHEIVEVDPQQFSDLAIGKLFRVEVCATDVEGALERVKIVRLHLPDLAKEVMHQGEEPQCHLLVPHCGRIVIFPPTKPEDEHPTGKKSSEAEPELLQEECPHSVLLAPAPHASVLLVPSELVAQILRIADADVHLGGKEILGADLEEVPLLQEEVVPPEAHGEAPRDRRQRHPEARTATMIVQQE
mmetsp:Transcript_30905/g.69593  ORF Transcript_30905/g.69593 Transcript_30905/m.69593 type:complete len:293 (-) Transcript_30905:322-1200(-)